MQTCDKKARVMHQTKYRNNVIMTSVSGRKTNKQIKLMKQMPTDMKHIILTNMNVKLYSWTLTFRKVEQQQICGVVLIPHSSTDLFWI